MNDNKTKIKLVFVPFLIILLTIPIGLTYLDWLLVIKYNFQIDELVLLILIPLALSLTSIFIFLYKKIKMLNIQSGNLSIYVLVPCITMVGLSFFALQYSILKKDKMTNLFSISQIDKTNPAKFYTLKNFYLDKKYFSIKKVFFSSSGKNTSNLEMYIYLAVPIFNSAKDTLDSNCMAWYGVQYHDTERDFLNHHDVKRSLQSTGYLINDIGMDTIKNSKEVKRFINESMEKFDNLNINQFLYLERISKSKIEYDEYISAIGNNTKYSTKSDIVLTPQNEPLAEKANENLIYLLAVFGIGSLLFLIMVITPKFEIGR